MARNIQNRNQAPKARRGGRSGGGGYDAPVSKIGPLSGRGDNRITPEFKGFENHASGITSRPLNALNVYRDYDGNIQELSPLDPRYRRSMFDGIDGRGDDVADDFAGISAEDMGGGVYNEDTDDYDYPDY